RLRRAHAPRVGARRHRRRRRSRVPRPLRAQAGVADRVPRRGRRRRRHPADRELGDGMSSAWQDSPPADDYTVDELMISVLASTLSDGDQACNGMASFLPVAAFMLAQRTHAPNLVWLAG